MSTSTYDVLGVVSFSIKQSSPHTPRFRCILGSFIKLSLSALGLQTQLGDPVTCARFSCCSHSNGTDEFDGDFATLDATALKMGWCI